MQDNKGRDAIEYGPLKTVFSISWLVAAGLWSAVVPDKRAGQGYPVSQPQFA